MNRGSALRECWMAVVMWLASLDLAWKIRLELVRFKLADGPDRRHA